jgi:hypothetical protein
VSTTPATQWRANMASTKRARIFISYKRVEPDTSVAREVFEALSQQHDVFIDQVIPVAYAGESVLRRRYARLMSSLPSCRLTLFTARW